MKRMLVALVAALSAVAVNAVEIGTLTWTGGTQSIAEDTHVTNLVVNGATTVTVAKGVTLTVDFLKGGKELTKKGNGAFVLKDFDPVYASSGLNIVKGTFRLGILGGGLAFPTVSSTPFYRVDAMCFVNSSTHKSHLNEKGGLAYWQGTGDAGTSSYSVGGVRPQLTFAYLGGKPVVDFGPYTMVKTESAVLMWNAKSTNIRETFIVAADTDDVISGDLDGQWYFGDDSGSSPLFRGVKRALARKPPYGTSYLGFYNGLFELDGEPATRDTVPAPGFHVVHQRSASDAAETASCRMGLWGGHEHGDYKGYGGIRIAEAMAFNGTLSDEDAAKITKYLQAKWLDGPSAKTLGTLKISGDAVIDMRAGDELTVGTLTVDGALKKIGAGTLHATVFNKSVGNVETAEGAFTYDSAAAAVGDAKTSFDVPANGTVQASRVTADGTFTKTGAGTLNAIVLAGGVNSIAVKGGTFKLLADDGVLPSGSHYRVDATNKGKLYVQPDGTCTYWEGMEGNSSWAEHARPRYSTDYLNGRPCADFGSYYCKRTNPDGYGGAFDWNAKTYDTKGVFVVFSDSDDVRESDTIAGQNIVGCIDAASFNRGADHALLSSSINDADGRMAELRANGIFEVDGVDTTYSTILPKGFHLVHIRLNQSSTKSLLSQSWGHSRYSTTDDDAYYGGMMMAEGAIYTKDLTEAEVASATKYFLNKWFKQVKSGEYAFEKLTVANGATLDLDGRTVAVTGLGGEGTVKAAGINLGANATLELDADASGVGKTTVTGALALPAACTVNFNGVPPKQGASYTILEAGSLTGDVTGWTIDTTNLPAHRTASVKKVGDTVVLTISAPGLIVVFK